MSRIDPMTWPDKTRMVSLSALVFGWLVASAIEPSVWRLYWLVPPAVGALIWRFEGRSAAEISLWALPLAGILLLSNWAPDPLDWVLTGLGVVVFVMMVFLPLPTRRRMRNRRVLTGGRLESSGLAALDRLIRDADRAVDRVSEDGDAPRFHDTLEALAVEAAALDLADDTLDPVIVVLRRWLAAGLAAARFDATDGELHELWRERDELERVRLEVLSARA